MCMRDCLLGRWLFSFRYVYSIEREIFHRSISLDNVRTRHANESDCSYILQCEEPSSDDLNKARLCMQTSMYQ